MRAGVAREFARIHVVPDIPGFRGFGEQAGEEVAELLLGGGHVFAAVDQGGEFGAVVPTPVADLCRVGLEDGLQSLPGGAWLGGGLGELGEVAGDVALVPGGQDRLDVGEVLVQRGPILAAVVLVHEIAEVFVIANGVRAGRVRPLTTTASTPTKASAQATAGVAA